MWARAGLQVSRAMRRVTGPLSGALALALAFHLGMRVGAETRVTPVQIVSPALLEALGPAAGAVAEAGGASGPEPAPVESTSPRAPLLEAEAARAGPGSAGTPCKPGLAAQATRAVDLNEATADELEALPGIGPVLARRIVEFRSRYGPFRQLDDLVEVTGVGPKTLQRLQGWLTVRPRP